MAFKKWVISKPDRENAKFLAEECSTDPFTALVACSRGITDASELELLLSDDALLCDPKELIDIDIAADIIKKAIEDDKLIAVFGDYDCDGVVSTTIMYDYLTSKNARVIPYIPDRIGEGYGMNIGAIDKLNALGVELIITVDNGISCFDEIEYANSLGISTVVTDHHIPPEQLPNALAVVDPHRADCPSSFKEVCGAQVAFKLICIIEDKEPEEMLVEYSDLLSIAVIGDVMPLINENRSIVKEGVKKIKHSPRVGIGAVLSVCGIDKNGISASKISFGIVPRINAAGRMGSAVRAFELLKSNNMLEAIGIANEIDAENTLRQSTEKEIFVDACQLIEANGFQNNRVIVVCGENWHLGIIGIVASRICEKYGKPAIVLSSVDGIAHGSGRSISGFHLYNAIKASSDTVLKFGGHELAAGVSVTCDSVNTFRKTINDYACTVLNVVPKINIDFCINPTGMSVDMAFALKELEPFGMGNPTPVFGILSVKLEKITPLSAGKHLKLTFSKEGTSFQALLFGVSPEKFCFEIGDVLDLAVTLDVNYFRDEHSLSVQIKAIRMNGTNEELLFDDIFELDSYYSGVYFDALKLLPSRNETGIIYKEISKHPVKADRLKYLFINEPGYAKTKISLAVLSELSLIENRDGIYYIKNCTQKTDLQNSKTYKDLYERVNNND